MSRPAQITIDFTALRHNLQQVRKMAPTCSVLAMIKSNAYGHGIERIGLALQEVEGFGVASLEEGLHLRFVGVKNPIVLMEGLFNADELPKAVAHDFTLVVHHHEQIDILEKHETTKPLPVWMKINTGMHRLGFDVADAEKAISV